MALAVSWKGKVYDDAEPLYCVAQDDWVFERVSGQWITGVSLKAQMDAAGHTPAETELGVPSEAWQDHHEPHEFWSGEAGGRDWGWSTSFPDPSP